MRTSNPRDVLILGSQRLRDALDEVDPVVLLALFAEPIADAVGSVGRRVCRRSVAAAAVHAVLVALGAPRVFGIAVRVVTPGPDEVTLGRRELNDGELRNGGREDEAAVVVGVLADQVDPARAHGRQW